MYSSIGDNFVIHDIETAGDDSVFVVGQFKGNGTIG